MIPLKVNLIVQLDLESLGAFKNSFFFTWVATMRKVNAGDHSKEVPKHEPLSIYLHHIIFEVHY